MRLFDYALRIAVFVLAALGAWAGAQQAAEVVEDRSVLAVRQTLHSEGYQWAEVLGDGLQVILEGEAPAEAARFRAISLAGGVVDASRVIDNMGLSDREEVAPPAFAVEILRHDAGVSMIGLIPAGSGRERLAERIEDLARDLPVTDLLETGNYPVPETWEEAVDYAVRALRLLPRAKISITAERVTVEAIADSPAEKRELDAALLRMIPREITATIDINAPRPVIAPFALRLTLDEDGAQFDACSADTEVALRRIVTAAEALGFTGRAPCILALGAPSRTWGEAAALSMAALGEIGGGALTILDTDVTLVSASGTAQEVFDDVVGKLSNDLPAAFALTAERVAAPEEQVPDDIARFSGRITEEGVVELRGRLADEEANDLLQTVAEAKFGLGRVEMRTRPGGSVPRGWSVRVLAATEALSRLAVGAVEVTPGRVSITGQTGDLDAPAEISALLIDRLGTDGRFDIDVTYDEALDPVAALPTPEQCIAQIGAITAERKITFAPGSDRITREAQTVVDEIAAILKGCGDLPIRIAGYTDSQGREEMNRALSQSRADAVLTAIRARRVPTSTFEAIGFGEETPIASNETEEGREANRRIEFSLISDEPEAVEAEATFTLAEGEDGRAPDLPEAEAPADAEADSTAPETSEAPETPGESTITVVENGAEITLTVTTLGDGVEAPAVTPRTRPEGLAPAAQ